jgi:ATP-dependent RNA helicase RhlE
MNFSELNLAPAILKAVLEQGYDTPTPIQAQAIPAVLEGRDLLGGAQTGTGKTAAFTLPMLHRLSMSRSAQNKFGGTGIRVLVLTPTRELAAQVEESVRTYGKYLQLSSTVIFGGVGMNPQISKLKKGVDILVATPGRLLDLQQQGNADFGRSRPHVGHGFYPRCEENLGFGAERQAKFVVLSHFQRRNSRLGSQLAQ